MLDVLLVVVLTAVCTCVGIPVARLLPSPPFAWRLLLAPMFGTAILAAAINVAYRFGASPGASLATACAAAVAGAALDLSRSLRARAAARENARPEWRESLPAGLVWAGAVALLLAPRWVGGDQFSVFQGNHADTFSYLGSALVYAREPYGFVTSIGIPEFLQNPLVSTAAANLRARPAVHLLYAAFSRVASADAYRLHYAFLVFLLSQAALVTAFMLRSWLPRARPVSVLTASLAFVLGFWGQYVFDINAWSQIGSVALLLFVFWAFVEVAASPRPGSPEGAPWRLAAALAVAVTGALYVYPEGLVYHLAVLVPLAITAVLLAAWRTRALAFDRFIPLLGVAGLATGLLYWTGTLRFVFVQVLWSRGTIVPWWRYSQAFFAGRDRVWLSDGVLAAVIDGGAGFFGLYFATPSWSTGLAALGQRLAIVAVLVTVLAAIVAVLAGRDAGAAPGVIPSVERARLRIAALATALLLVPAASMAAQANYWGAGKAVSFVSPVLMTLLAAPLAVPMPPLRNQLRWATAAFVAFQIATGFARVNGARAPSGIHYASPYPAVEIRALKEVLRWDLRPLASRLPGVRRVLIAPMNPWTSYYLMAYLSARNVDFFPLGYALGPITENFGASRVLRSAAPPWRGDAMIELAQAGLLVQYMDGRPPALLPWRP